MSDRLRKFLDALMTTGEEVSRLSMEIEDAGEDILVFETEDEAKTALTFSEEELENWDDDEWEVRESTVSADKAGAASSPEHAGR